MYLPSNNINIHILNNGNATTDGVIGKLMPNIPPKPTFFNEEQLAAQRIPSIIEKELQQLVKVSLNE